jgi:nucleoside-diphosphate-sugar epimerase
MSGERRVLLTGASGLVGHAVLQRLRTDGAAVLALGRDNGGDLARSPWPAGPWDVIVHCAARLPGQFGGAEEAAAAGENRLLDDRALEAATASGAHLIFLSSASVYGLAGGEITEATPAAPVLAYAREKLATEDAIAARGISATVFRLVAPYGPRQTRNTVLRRFLDLALTGMPLRYFGSGNRTQDFLHVDDAAEAVGLAVRNRPPDRFILASGEPVGMSELAHLVVEATGSRSVVEPAGVPDPEEGRTVRYRIDHLRQALGFRPSISLRAGIAAWAAVRRPQLLSGAAP